MTVQFLESAGAATNGLEFYSTAIGTVGTEDDGSGLRRLYFGTGASQNAAVYTAAVLGNAGRMVLHFRYVAISGTGRAWTLTFRNASLNSWVLCVRSTADTLELINGANGTSLGTGSINIKDGALHRIAVAWSITSSSVNELRVWVNGTLDITASNVTITNPNVDQVRIGEGAGSPYLRWKLERGVYIDDDSSLTDPGDRRVTKKRPASDNTGQYDTPIGSGTNRYDRVRDIPLSVVNGWRQAGSSAAAENYGIEAASAGDIDISGATIHGYTGWMYAKRDTEGDTRIATSGNSYVGFVSDKTSNHTTTVIPVSYAVPAGSAIFVGLACDDDGNPGTSPTCTDSQGNTYALAVTNSHGGSQTGSRGAILYALNCTALSTSDTITITHGTVDASAGAAVAYGGVLTSAALDKTNSLAQTNDSPSTGSTGTLSQAEEVGVGVFANETAYPETSSAFQTPLTYRAAAGTGTQADVSNQWVSIATAALNSTAAINHAADGVWGNGSKDRVGCIATFKAVTGGVALGSPKFTVEGTDYDVTLGSSNAMFTKVLTSSAYPSNAAAIGAKAGGTTVDSYLYECGILVAFTPAVPRRVPGPMLIGNTAAHHRARARASF